MTDLTKITLSSYVWHLLILKKVQIFELFYNEPKAPVLLFFSYTKSSEGFGQSMAANPCSCISLSFHPF